MHQMGRGMVALDVAATGLIDLRDGRRLPARKFAIEATPEHRSFLVISGDLINMQGPAGA
jgi:hypothetical protein